jgi:vacuolar-type H+-ATPase subunit C/Vma6
VFEGAVQEYLASSRYQGIVRDRSPETAWKSLLREYRWVYTQMNARLRDQFGPFFLYTELRTIFLCLRRLDDKNQAAANDLLEMSLLSDDIKTVLSASRDRVEAVRRLERILTPASDRFAGMTELLDAGGLRGVEQTMTDGLLEVIMKRRLQPLIRRFFGRLIDARNILRMYKYLRLEETSFPFLLPGGTVPEARLRDTVAKENFPGICSLVREISGIAIDSADPTKVEIALYRGVSVFLRREGREPFGVGPILDYLWRCSIEVMNVSVLLNGKDLERDLVSAELVQ